MMPIPPTNSEIEATVPSSRVSTRLAPSAAWAMSLRLRTGQMPPCPCSLCQQRCPATGHLAIHWKYATGKPRFQVLVEPLFKLDAALTLGKQLNSLLNFGQGDDAHMLGLAAGGLQPALDARVGASRPVVFGQNIRINQETAHPRSTGRG